jgi:hypothetical protein
MDIPLMGIAHHRHLADGYGTHNGKSLLGCALEKIASRLQFFAIHN